ncbi:hypothetical protein GGI07_001451 [Coemansia sp. Benny D115]|nr:hypothetical protein GGI07_001451 [Coemansia sp. Benny D115]
MDDNSNWEISAIYTYPVKSCQGISQNEARVSSTGLEYDRLWMVIDAKSNRFITQRQHPRLALVKPTIHAQDGYLELTAPDMPEPLRVPLTPDSSKGDRVCVRVWYDDVWGRCCGPEAAAWFSAFTGKPARLLSKDPETPRLVSRYAPAPEICPERPQSGFADVFPFHLITEESLEDVNCHVPRPLTDLNFRPNLVLRSRNRKAPAYDEESWKTLWFSDSGADGGWTMFVTSRTPRCTMPNVDLAVGKMSEDRQPMASLNTFRRTDPGKPNYACFGMQAAPQRIGQTIALGQSVHVRERGLHALTEPL